MRVRLVIASALLLPLGAACDTGAVPRGDGPLATSQCDAGPPAVATAASGKPLTPAALHPSFPREAVDHTVTYASGEPEGGDRMVVSRHGHFVRREVRHIRSKRHSGPDREVSFLKSRDRSHRRRPRGPDGRAHRRHVLAWRAIRSQRERHGGDRDDSRRAMFRLEGLVRRQPGALLGLHRQRRGRAARDGELRPR